MPDELRRVAEELKQEVAGVRDLLAAQDAEAVVDRRTRTRRFWLAGTGVVLAVFLVCVLVWWTEIAARARFANLQQQQRDALCPLLYPILQQPGPLTEREQQYREQVRRSVDVLGCPPLDPADAPPATNN